MVTKFPLNIFSVAIIILSSSASIFLPTVSGDASENYPLSDVLTNPYSLSGSSAVTYSNDGAIIAVAYYHSVVIIDSTYRTFIKEINVGNKVMDVTFSDDDAILLVGLESPYMSTLAMALYETTDWVRIGVNEDGKEVNDISVLPGSEIFASSNEEFGANEYTFEDPSNKIFTYEGEHTDAVTCLDHTPDGNFLITGSADGSVVIWNRTNQNVAEFQGNPLIWPTEFQITDCAVSPDGSQLAWTANTLLQVRTIPEGNYVTSLVLDGYAEQLEWSRSADELWIHTQSSSPNILVLDTNNFDAVNNYDLGHRVAEFALSPFEDEFVASSNSAHITVFRKNQWAPYVGMVGLDSDGDGTPNIYDSDDDGDGVGDDYEFACSEGSNCSLHPDPSLVRQISVSISGNKITILDKLELNSTQSAPIRELAAATVTSDGLVDEGEALKIQKMLCSGTDNNAVLSDWREAIHLNSSVYVSGTVRCDAKLGLSGTEKFDSKTRIQLRWFIEIVLSNNVKRPFTITFDPSISAPEHTVSQIVPNSPFSLTITHDNNGVHYDFPLYGVDSVIEIDIDELPEPSPTILDLALNWILVNYWIPLTTILFLVGFTLIVVRRRNRILFDYEDEEEVVTTRRTSTRRQQPRGPPVERQEPRPQPKARPKPIARSHDSTSATGRPQPIHPSYVAKKRKVKRETIPHDTPVKKVRITETHIDEDPVVEDLDYEMHESHLESDDSDPIDSHDDVSDLRVDGNMMKDIAKQVSAENQVKESPNDLGDDDDDEAESFVEDAMMAALTKITDAESPIDSSGSDTMKSDGDKKRRKVKRRKK